MSFSSKGFTADGWIEAPDAGKPIVRPWEMGEMSGGHLHRPGPADPPVSAAEAWDQAIHAAREEGRAEGHATGAAEGRRSEEARTRSALDAAARAVSGVEVRMVRMEEAAKRDIPALAIAIASHLVGREVQADPAILARLVQRAVSEFLPDEPVRIRVNPRDLALLSAPMGATADGDGPVAGRTVRWISDPEVRPGGCLVESRERLVDGRVDTALERIYRAITEDVA